MKEIKIELLGIAIILLGIVLRANSFFEYFLGVFGFVTIFVGDLCRGGICLARSAVRYK